MSQQHPAHLSISSRNLSACGTRIASGDRCEPADITTAAALATLQGFAAIPRIDLVEVEAKVYLTSGRGKFAVQNMGGRLAVALVPEAVNVAVEGSPEQILAFVIEAIKPDPAVATDEAHPALGGDRSSPDFSRRPSALKQALVSPWMAGALVVANVALFYWLFASTTPDGVKVISDPARITQLTSELAGRYGAPNSTTLTVAEGKLSGSRSGPGGEQKVFELGYRFAERNTEVLLLTANGAEIDLQPDRSLKFLDSAYPRHSK